MAARTIVASLLLAGLAACAPVIVATPTPRLTTAAPTTSAPVVVTASPSPSPSPSPTPAPTPTPAPAGYNSPRGTITVDQPRALARVTSPLAVSGSAMLFEAAFRWRLSDLSGRELASGSGMTSAGAPERGTFSFTVTFTVASDTYAYLAVISHSARDGSVDDEARVPVVLTASR